MFIGIRDINFARGRFMLITAVIAMMAFLVVALSALTDGLQGQSISAVTRLPGESVVMQEPAEGQAPSLAQSSLDDEAVRGIRAASDGHAALLGVSTTRLGHAGTTSALSLFGADPSLMPHADVGSLPGPGGVLLSHEQADESGLHVGDSVTVGPETLRVTGIGDAGSFAHTPVGYTTVDTWRSVSPDQGLSAVVLSGAASGTPDGTETLPMSDITDAVPGYGSEHGSLLAMQVMLLAISALVVGAFFTVWTQQRRHDLAVVRAMGADRGYLLRDGLGQAVAVLMAGQAVGVAAGVLLAEAASGTVPIVLSASGIAIPVVAMTVLGLAGAFLAVRAVTKVDPLVAMSR